MKPTLTIGWLYPELMSTYGDRGNITVLTRRAEWRHIPVRVLPVTFTTDAAEIEACHLIFGGGAQDRQQEIVIEDLRVKKGPVLKRMFERDVPGLFVCGAPQLLGDYYMTGDGKRLEGLKIFPMESKHFGKAKPRCIGNTVCHIDERFRLPGHRFESTIVGFENHGGRTYLHQGTAPFAKVVKGFGNNGEDGTEGALYHNCIATYSHGPFLPKNPHIADWLLFTALSVRDGKPVELVELPDEAEWQAHRHMVRRLLGGG